jgi:hypothetical protein
MWLSTKQPYDITARDVAWMINTFGISVYSKEYMVFNLWKLIYFTVPCTFKSPSIQLYSVPGFALDNNISEKHNVPHLYGLSPLTWRQHVPPKMLVCTCKSIGQYKPENQHQDLHYHKNPKLTSFQQTKEILSEPTVACE